MDQDSHPGTGPTLAELIDGLPPDKRDKLTRIVKRTTQKLANNGKVFKRGIRFRFPEDQSVVDFIRDRASIPTDELARVTDLDRRSIGFIRRLVILHNRKDLSNTEHAALAKALVLIDTERQTGSARKVADPIIKKYWVEGTLSGYDRRAKRERDRLVKKQIDRLESTMFAIRETCEHTEDIEIPDELSEEQRKEACVSLSTAIWALRALLKRIQKPRRQHHAEA